jgi:arsenate reductase (thioredoxin)
MNSEILKTISRFSEGNISMERKNVLQSLVSFIQEKSDAKTAIRLNFICTHNSRRSHLSQIWAQSMSTHFGIPNVSCYSGGTEATAMYPKIVETLSYQGFQVMKLSESTNSVFAVKFDEVEPPIICFSKEFNHDFNPKTFFGAVMTCDHADEGCPMVTGAEARFSITYEDPKRFDNTDFQTEKYIERSLEIGQEMWWVFQSIKNCN